MRIAGPRPNEQLVGGNCGHAAPRQRAWKQSMESSLRCLIKKKKNAAHPVPSTLTLLVVRDIVFPDKRVGGPLTEQTPAINTLLTLGITHQYKHFRKRTFSIE